MRANTELIDRDARASRERRGKWPMHVSQEGAACVGVSAESSSSITASTPSADVPLMTPTAIMTTTHAPPE